MRIYFGHSRDFDYEREYYAPIEASEALREDELIMPHKGGTYTARDREFYACLDLFVAEVSCPSIGLGIELGWASSGGVPIYCLYKKGAKPTGALRAVTDNVIEYESGEDLVGKVEQIVSGFDI